MQPGRSSISSLPEPLARLFSVALKRGMQFPACRVPSVSDYELRTRARLQRPGDRPDLAGMANGRINWLRATGYHSAAGIFRHIVPEGGSAGILLPVGAEPETDSTGNALFSAERTPTSGRMHTAGIGIQADERLGMLAALLVLCGIPLPDGDILLKPSSGIASGDLDTALADCRGLATAIPLEQGWQVQLSLRLDPRFASLASGHVPAGMRLWDCRFHRGIRQILLLHGTLRPKFRAPDRVCALHELATMAGLRISFYPDGRLVCHASPGPFWSMPFRAETVMLPSRASWPTADGICVHPSGLLYRLMPGEPFGDLI